MMEQLEQAIVVSSDPNQSNEFRQRAALYINEFLAQQDGWKRCLEGVFSTQNTVATVFYFETLRNLTLHNYDDLSGDEKALLRSALIKWLKEYTTTNPKIDSAVKGKFAQVIVAVFRLEYPQNWSDFFPQLFSALTIQPFSPQRVELFLRILASIDELVISLEFARSNAELALSNSIKDHMRDDCVTKLASTWFQILSELSPQYPHLGSLALKNIRYYVGWIDIQLIVNDNFVALFFKLLEVPVLRERVCLCLEQIVTKGMEFQAKVAMIKYLRLFQLISSVRASDDEDFMLSVGKLLNSVGMQAIQCRKEAYLANSDSLLLDNMEKLVEESISLTGTFLRHEDDGISETVLPFINAFLYKLRHKKPLSDSVLRYLQSLLEGIALKMKYHSSFNFEQEEDDEALFLDFRKELEKLFKSVVRYAPELSFAFVQGPLAAMLSQDCTKIPMPDLEAFLRLFYVMGEGIRLPDSSYTSYFSNMMELVMSSNLTSFPHEAVIVDTFEILVRYSPSIPKLQEESVKKVLLAFLGDCGIRHRNPFVRGRASYLFLRIVRDLTKDIRPYFEHLMESIMPLLNIALSEQDQPLTDSDQQYLFEIAGIITFELRDNQVAHIAILERLVTPLLSNIEQILKEKLFVNDPPDNPQFASYLVRAINALGIYSKGFKHCTKEAQERFTRGLSLMVLALQLLPLNEEVRGKIMFYLHRMIECMQKEIFPYMPACLNQMFDPIPSAQSFISVIRIVNQLITRFRADVVDMLDVLLLTLTQRLFAFYPQIDDPSDQKELQRFYFLFIQAILQSNLGHLFFNDKNLPHFASFFTPIIQGSKGETTENTKNVKLCFVILFHLISKEQKKQEAVIQMIPNIVDATFTFLGHPMFTIHDAECNLAISFIIKIHKMLVLEFAPLIAQRMKLIPGVTEDSINIYFQSLTNKTQHKNATKFIQDMAQHLSQQ